MALMKRWPAGTGPNTDTLGPINLVVLYIKGYLHAYNYGDYNRDRFYVSYTSTRSV